MLANKLSRGPQILRGCSSHAPAATVAFARFLPTNNRAVSRKLNTVAKRSHSMTTKCAEYQRIERPQKFDRHWFATQPIICSHEDAFAKDLSAEEFDNAYKFLYEQHGHAHGPWVKVLNSAQHILTGDSPRVLVIASGPGQPAAILAQNFKNAEIISAHSTTKCIEWSKERFNNLGLDNVTPKLVPDMDNLDFSNSSFDLVVSGYGLSNSLDPQKALKEVHRVLKPGGRFLSYVWEQLPADPGSDIILRHACVGPNPWHKTEDGVDAVGSFKCPVRTSKATSLSKPHLLENMIEQANLSLVEVSRDEYPLTLGDTKEKAFKTLTLPIRAELQELKASNHYHPSDAAEAFEDVLNEGFMVKQHANGEMIVPYNTYKYVVARREFEDGDTKEPKYKRNGKKTFKVDDIPK